MSHQADIADQDIEMQLLENYSELASKQRQRGNFRTAQKYMRRVHSMRIRLGLEAPSVGRSSLPHWRCLRPWTGRKNLSYAR